MHLRSITLRGFKSFPDRVEVRLEPGVAVVVGPNGSGKSNVADALLWAAGSQSPSELRAERADDVLFAGGAGRPAADFCEVELLFDNADGALPGLDFAEVSVARRLHRGGEGQYLVNRAQVRRTDLVELLSEVGLGGGLRSVISQGRVEEILASRPEERRALVEEAAGLGRFKRRRHRAELKLARVRIQTERARDLEAEVKARLRPLALQATAAERAEKLGLEAAALEARIAELDAEAIEGRLAEAEERRTGAALARRRTDGALEAVLGERDRAEEELADAAGRREAATSALYRLRSAGDRLDLRRESAETAAARIRAAVEDAGEPEEPSGPPRHLLERAAEDSAAAARAAAAERDALAEKARLARDRLAALERSQAEREGLPPAARALSEEGARLALSLLEVESGYERAVAAALSWRAAALVAPDPAAGLALIERSRAAGLGSLGVLVPPVPKDVRQPRPPLGGAEPLLARARPRAGGERVAELLEDVWLVPAKDLARAERGLVVTREGHRFDPVHGELWFAGETAEAVQLELGARRRALGSEAETLAERATEAADAATRAAAEARRAAAELEASGPARPRRGDPVLLGRLLAAAERLGASLAAAREAAARFETPLRARVDAGSTRTAELASQLRELGARESELRRAAGDAAQRAAAVEVELAGLNAELAEAKRHVEAPGVQPAEGEDREELAARLERLDRRRGSLGRVNPLAKEDYEREKLRLEELTAQREDLERSLDELERLRAEFAETVERRFAETFAAVEKHFRQVAETLFPGGKGRLRLTEDEDGEEGEPGVEVELQPAGKKITRLSLLSGGEKALGAIAFLFSLFLARPAPFYLLDEVEAALDDTNIGRFVELLRRYSERAQFVVITHQKRTMEAADVLYGVTMGPDGISQVVSRRLPREEPAALSA